MKRCKYFLVLLFILTFVFMLPDTNNNNINNINNINNNIIETHDNYRPQTISLKNESILSTKAITSVSLDKDEFIYNGETQKPTVTVKEDNNVLLEGQDYTLTYNDSNLIDAGIKTIVINGINNYTGSFTKTYEIKKAENKIYDLTYTNGIPSAKAKFGEVKFVYYKDNDLNAPLKRPTFAGKYLLKAYVEETNNYTVAFDSIEIDFRISIKNALILGLKDNYEYTGNEIKPEFMIKVNGLVLDESNIKITYENNIEIGKATMIIEGYNYYTDKISYSFDITKKGEIIKDFRIENGKPTASTVSAPIKYIYSLDKNMTEILDKEPTKSGTYYVKAVIDDPHYVYFETPVIEYVFEETNNLSLISTIIVSVSIGLIVLGITGYALYHKFKPVKKHRKR